MDTPKKTATQSENPVSKLKLENSPVYNYINSLSPIKPVRSLTFPQTIGSLSYSSPPSVFTSPHASSHKGSRFKSDDTNSSKDVPASVGEEALHETEPPQIQQNECTTIATPPRVISDNETDLLKMCDGNVKQKSEIPDWNAMILGYDDILIDDPNNESEASRCFLERSTESKARLLSVTNSDDALHRRVTKRCLDFEMPGNNKHMSVESSSRCVVANIGLHLSTIAVSSKDNSVGNDYSLSGHSKVGLRGSISAVHNSQETVKDNGQGLKEGAMSLALVELNQSSPKKKRRKVEQAGEAESSCKRCNCKRSKCLKLYCECFAAGVYCIGTCSCVDCFNKPIHEDTVMSTRKQIESRNPLAFAPKVIGNSDSVVEIGDGNASKTPASARHKRGCNCKKSNCLKKYCECYQSGVGCSINCRCEGCKNAFGKKYVSAGSSFTGVHIKQDKENETSERGRTEKQPSTPMPLRQPLAHLPISSNNILLPHQHLHGASGSSLLKSQSSKRQDMSLLSHSNIETITEKRADDIENLIQSPITNMINNAVIPNSKRGFSASCRFIRAESM